MLETYWKNGQKYTREVPDLEEFEEYNNEPTLEEKVIALEEENEILTNALLELSMFVYGGGDNG